MSGWWEAEDREEKTVNTEIVSLVGDWVSVLLSTPKMSGWQLFSLGIEVKYENVRPERRKLDFL